MNPLVALYAQQSRQYNQAARPDERQGDLGTAVTEILGGDSSDSSAKAIELLRERRNKK